MEKQKIAGLSLIEWKEKYPLIKKLIKTDEVFWLNPNYGSNQGISIAWI
ncbi:MULTISPECIES: hypothetical protein [unclassified Peribacillus]|nr:MULTISPECIES: hypothetical protein [unclassified Peribacillus]MBK5441913.1 hypothetical protein [Peribacillus sp. TH24]MBK5463309.1 hypothetical protein [Peribacillus sp. TH27]MBK5501553.1 hypothetical protein [Peribacillus sp. TH14]WMX53516.1 hypothetical protein RE409_15585 [Peribacillus sp. R9-11]